MEEVGESAEAALELPDDPTDHDLKHLKKEVIQVAAVSVAFYEYLERYGKETKPAS